jgi:hypothetical protein
MKSPTTPAPHLSPKPNERRARSLTICPAFRTSFRDRVVPTIDCIIRDISESGARLRMTSTTEVPKSFLLLIKDDNVIVPVQRVWRNAHDVGVKFTGNPRTAFC